MKALAAAATLREIILEREDGAYLGSQEDLIRLLGIGRVTLQQTSRLLEQERVLRVRRGVNGGYYGARPDEGGVERAVAVYLRAAHSGFAEAYHIRSVLVAAMLRLAALSTNEAARDELRRVGETFEDLDLPEDYERVIQAEKDFYEAIYKLAANPLGELILRVTSRLYLEGSGSHFLERTAETKISWRRTRQNMIRAVLDQDPDFAQILARRFAGEVAQRVEDAYARRASQE